MMKHPRYLAQLSTFDVFKKQVKHGEESRELLGGEAPLLSPPEPTHIVVQQHRLGQVNLRVSQLHYLSQLPDERHSKKWLFHA